jgi:phosphoglucomutase
MKLDAIQSDQRKVENLIKENVITEQDVQEKGNLNTVKKLSDWVAKYNEDMKKALDLNDIRNARLHLAEVKYACSQMEDHLTMLAKEMGLPDFDF